MSTSGLLLPLPSVILWNTCVHFIISATHLTSSSAAASSDTSPLFEEILLIRGGEDRGGIFNKNILNSNKTNDGKKVEDPENIRTHLGSHLYEDIEPEDLVRFVTQLERQAQAEEQTVLLPEIMGILEGALKLKYPASTTPPTYTFVNDTNYMPLDEWKIEGKELEHDEEYLLVNESLPVDLSDISEDIVDQVAEGVEESLRLSDDTEVSKENLSGGNGTQEMRQLSVYLFQGQYIPEPRLNRFIDGAIRNMGTELRVAIMDPLYFRVLPRGRVESRDKPIQPIVKINVNRRPVRNKKKVKVSLSRRRKRQRPMRLAAATNILVRRRRQKQRQQQLRRQRQKQRQRQRQRQKQKQKQKQVQKQKQHKLKQRIRRRIRQDVGGGRVEGLSRVTRDGDAEMQLFGNYTLIRSHMKLGPVELTMQFRTQRGIRRTGATLPVLRVHSVTRVNQDGSEMIDFLLDRPHPETIRVRGKLFPLAERIAKNVFSRLFLPESFLVQKVREKAGLALLSKPSE